MTSYFTVESIFDYESNSVENIYHSFFKRNFIYLKPCLKDNSELSLNEIIAWNESKLKNLSESDTPTDFRQIMLNHPGYDKIILSLSFENDFIFLDMMIPEENIFEWKNNKAYYYKSRIDELINLSIGLWQENTIELIHTQWEIEPYDIEIETELVFNPFGIMKNENYDVFENKKRYKILRELPDSKVLIIKE